MADQIRVLTVYPPAVHVTGQKAPVKRQPRKPTLASELRQARRAGLSVTAAIIDPDGRLSLQFGEPTAESVESNPWDRVLNHAQN